MLLMCTKMTNSNECKFIVITILQLWRYADSVDEIQVSKLGRWWVGWQCSDILHRGDCFKNSLLWQSHAGTCTLYMSSFTCNWGEHLPPNSSNNVRTLLNISIV